MYSVNIGLNCIDRKNENFSYSYPLIRLLSDAKN